MANRPTEFSIGLRYPRGGVGGERLRQAVRANGVLAAPGHNPIQILRGVGSGFISETNSDGMLVYLASVCPLAVAFSINLESITAWTSVGSSSVGVLVEECLMYNFPTTRESPLTSLQVTL